MIAALDLFAGAAGGWSLGMSRAGYRTVAACEIDPWRNAVFAASHPGCRMYADVRDLSASRLVSDLGYLPSVIVGSPPCQDISAANTKGQGIDGSRSGLFWEALRLIDEIRPVWACLENSPRLRTLGYDALAAELETIGYACWPLVVGADNVGANHRRKRVWIVAADAALIRRTGSMGQPAQWPQERLGLAGDDLSVTADAERLQLREQSGRGEWQDWPSAAVAGGDDPDADCNGGRSWIDQAGRQGGARPQGDDPYTDMRRCSQGFEGRPEVDRRRQRRAEEDARAWLDAEPDDTDADGNGWRGREGRRLGSDLSGTQAHQRNAPHPHSPRHPLRPRERADDGTQLPPALRAIGSAWPDWNGGLPGLAAACAAAGFGHVDDERATVLAPGVRNRAIAALGDSIVPQIAEAIGRAMMRLTVSHREAAA